MVGTWALLRRRRLLVAFGTEFSRTRKNTLARAFKAGSGPGLIQRTSFASRLASSSEPQGAAQKVKRSKAARDIVLVGAYGGQSGSEGHLKRRRRAPWVPLPKKRRLQVRRRYRP